VVLGEGELARRIEEKNNTGAPQTAQVVWLGIHARHAHVQPYCPPYTITPLSAFRLVTNKVCPGACQ
jgi:hypothetical protein